MIINKLFSQIPEDTVGSGRQYVTAGVTEEGDIVRKRIIPEKYKDDVAAIERYIGEEVHPGTQIDVLLTEMLSICPRTRRRIDSYNGLVNYLRDELEVTLTIKSQKDGDKRNSK